MAGVKLTASAFITITKTPGRCRWCQCTYERPCDVGCGWANREQTLCTACVPFDQAMNSKRGRRELAEFLQEHGFDGKSAPALTGSTVSMIRGGRLVTVPYAKVPAQGRR